MSMRKRVSGTTFLLLGVSIVFALFTRTHKFLTVSGCSMEPTLYDSNMCLVENFIVPVRGDIYVIGEPDSDLKAIKRLIGVPGDVVELRDCQTIVNGAVMPLDIEGTWEDATFYLGADEYLFIGDNRKESFDGRYWSRYVTRSEILYHVTYQLYPLHRFGRLE